MSLYALILGFVEGLTEFLPVSSTFHLLMVGHLIGWKITNFTSFFDIVIQGAAILPVLFLFGKEWFQDKNALIKLATAFVPTAIVGFVLHNVIKEVLFVDRGLMLTAFASVGLLFFFVEWLVKRGKLKLHKTIAQLSYAEAILIGLFQAMAVLPGVSRAGAVIIGMLLLGYRRDESAKFSFMLAVPTILAASGLDIIKMRNELSAITTDQTMALVIGCVTAFLSSFIIVRWFIGYLRGHSLNVFGWYRLIAAAIFFMLS